MMPGQGEFTLFGELVELDAAARAARLDALQAGDPALAERLRRLLLAHGQPLLERPLVPDDDTLPASIGGYRVLERIGRGGMGNVYLCEQIKPVRRTVAVKVLRAGLDTRDVVARFETERQALALMVHPGIARIFAAGETDDGRPYFVMEHVPGAPLPRYCREQRLDLRQRLQLFVRVCGAVQHAHQKGVVHRDLKPSNILVVEEDGEPVPRIIDFGIAKTLGAHLTGRTLHTLSGNLVGTPEYMSPEQADIGAVDVDTRSDVWSLGVVLYELLAGTVPFRFDGAVLSLHTIQQRLRREQPAAPGANLLQQADGDDHARACGFSGAPALARALRGDLDAIVQKAMQKNRARRYASAAELADDIARYLAREPVSALRAGSLYRLRKFLRRNALPLVGTALLAGLLLGFSVYARVQAEELALQRDLANRQAAKARQVGEFFATLFTAESTGGRPLGMREALGIGARRARAQLANQPDVQAELLHAIGRVYNALGLYAEAELALGDAIVAAGNARPADEALRRRVRAERAHGLLLQEKFAEAEPELLNLLAVAAGDPASKYAQLLLGELYMRTGRISDAERLMRGVLESTGSLEGKDRDLHGMALLMLGQLYAESSRFAEARPLLEHGIALLGTTSLEHGPEVLNARGLLMWVLATEGKYDQALPYAGETLELARRIYGERHPATAMARSDVGFVLAYMKDYAAAETVLEQALAETVAALGDFHSRTAITLNNLASVYDQTGRHAEALALYHRVLAIDERLSGVDAGETAGTLQNIGFLLLKTGEPAGAERHFRRTIELLDRVYGDAHWALANARRGLGIALQRQQRFAEAEPELCASLAVLRDNLGAEHERVLAANASVASFYAEWRTHAAQAAGRSCS